MIARPVSAHKPVFTNEEQALIRRLNTPGKVQEFLIKEIVYDNQDDIEEEKETWRSLRRVIRDRKAHCFEGALAAAAIMMQHNYPPLILCMEARDIDHIVFAYRRKGKWGSLAKSRDENLLSRAPHYRGLRDLVMSYYPFFYNLETNDLTDLTIRGYAKVDLRIFDKDWITTEEDVTFIVDHLYRIPYRKLFPRNRDDRFYFSLDAEGNISGQPPKPPAEMPFGVQASKTMKE